MSLAKSLKIGLYRILSPYPTLLVTKVGPDADKAGFRRGQRWRRAPGGFWFGPGGEGPRKWPLNVGGSSIVLGTKETELGIQEYYAGRGKVWPG